MDTRTFIISQYGDFLSVAHYLLTTFKTVHGDCVMKNDSDDDVGTTN